MPAEEPAQDEPKLWELRAAWRAFQRSKEGRRGRNPAQQIVDAAWELVEQQDDFTVKDVAKRANVALQTFYRHFGSKDELLLAMMEENIGRGSSAIAEAALQAGDPQARLRQLIEQAILGIDDDSEEAALRRRRLQWSARERQRLSQRFPVEVDAVHEGYRIAVLEALEAAVAAGAAKVDDPVLTANVIQHLVMTMVHLVASGGVEASSDDVAEAVVDLVWRGVRA